MEGAVAYEYQQVLRQACSFIKQHIESRFSLNKMATVVRFVNAWVSEIAQACKYYIGSIKLVVVKS